MFQAKGRETYIDSSILYPFNFSARRTMKKDQRFELVEDGDNFFIVDHHVKKGNANLVSVKFERNNDPNVTVDVNDLKKDFRYTLTSATRELNFDYEELVADGV